MPGPGSGRYTNYTPLDTASAERYARRQSLFNAKADGGRGDVAFQNELVDNAKSVLEAGEGDAQMFPAGVNMAYGNAPVLADTQLNRAGDPANQYMPDISSPGAIDGRVNVNPTTKLGQGSISVQDANPAYVVSNSVVDQSSDSLGGMSPHVTSAAIGATPLSQTLVMGKSRGTLGG